MDELKKEQVLSLINEGMENNIQNKQVDADVVCMGLGCCDIKCLRYNVSTGPISKV